jgi:hypothetical protein
MEHSDDMHMLPNCSTGFHLFTPRPTVIHAKSRHGILSSVRENDLLINHVPFQVHSIIPFFQTIGSEISSELEDLVRIIIDVAVVAKVWILG